MQFLTSDLFKDFPTLKFVIPHGGGAVPYHWGRYRGMAQDLKRPPLTELLLNNVYFDTCVYHQPGIDLLTKVIPADNILFASEMVGAVKGIDPETGHYFDDTQTLHRRGLLAERRGQAENLRGQRPQGLSAAPQTDRAAVRFERRGRSCAGWRLLTKPGGFRTLRESAPDRCRGNSQKEQATACKARLRESEVTTWEKS